VLAKKVKQADFYSLNSPPQPAPARSFLARDWLLHTQIVEQRAQMLVYLETVLTLTSTIMAQYQLVEKHDIEHHNEYFEVRTTQTDNPRSLFFITNEENLEDTAASIITDHLPDAKHWTVIPHRKDRDNLMYDTQ